MAKPVAEESNAGAMTGSELLREAIVPMGATLVQAMEAIDRTGLSVALVCDGGRLAGIATDGDIRRALLSGLPLTALVTDAWHTHYVAVDPDTTRAQALQLMLERGITCVPVVDSDRRLLDVYTLRGSLVGPQTSSWAVVMAGGRGERLGELTAAMPKPMLPIGNRPILEHIVHLLVSHGIKRIFISVNYLGGMIVDHFGDGERFHCRIEYLREDEPLGTGGPLSLLPEAPCDPLVVMNGDLVTGINLTRVLAHHERGGYCATMVLREHRVQVPYGVAQLQGGVVMSLTEKPTLDCHVNAGIYVLQPELVARVPKGRPTPITELFKDSIARGEPIGAYLLDEDWADVGLPDEYRRAHDRRSAAAQ